MTTLADLPTTDQECFDQVVAHIYSDGIICPWQSHPTHHVTEKYLWCGICRRKWSLKKQVGFGYSKLSWRKILELVTCFQGKQSPGDIIISTGLRYWTIQRWCERLRDSLPLDEGELSGLVEIDQSWPGRQKHSNQVLIMGGVERDTARIRIVPILSMEQDSIEEFLETHVETQSLIYADAHGSHLGLEAVGYGLVTCNHDRGHFGPTNRIENVWSCLDRFVIRTRDHFMKRFLVGILREFQARRNHPELFRDPFTLLKSMAVPV